MAVTPAKAQSFYRLSFTQEKLDRGSKDKSPILGSNCKGGKKKQLTRSERRCAEAEALFL